MDLDSSTNSFIFSDQLPDRRLLRLVLRSVLSQALAVYQSDEHRVQPTQIVAVAPEKLIWNGYKHRRLRWRGGRGLVCRWSNALRFHTRRDAGACWFLRRTFCVCSELRCCSSGFAVCVKGLVGILRAASAVSLRWIKTAIYPRSAVRRWARGFHVSSEKCAWGGLLGSRYGSARRRSENILRVCARVVVFIP